MKSKIWFLIVLWCVWGFIFGHLVYGANNDDTATQTISKDDYGGKVIKLVCTADSDGGAFSQAVDSTRMDQVRGHFLYEVHAYRTTSGTAPTDASDVTIRDQNYNFLCGSEDDGTTAYAGVDVIDATENQVGVFVPNMYSHRAGEHFTHYYHIDPDMTLTVTVLNNSVNSANFTIELKFIR